MRHAARTDANQAEIAQALRAVGAYVWFIGLPVDLLVGYRGRTILMEVKSHRKAKKTALQASFFESWKGDSLVRVNNVSEALTALGIEA